MSYCLRNVQDEVNQLLAHEGIRLTLDRHAAESKVTITVSKLTLVGDFKDQVEYSHIRRVVTDEDLSYG